MAFANAQAFYNATINKSFNTDNAYGAQCWDLFDYFCNQEGLPISRYCKNTGWVSDLWYLRDAYGYSEYFEYITNPDELRQGDWCIWASPHIAMYWAGTGFLGQNQPYPYTNIQYFSNYRDRFLGAFRYKKWSKNVKPTPSGEPDQILTEGSKVEFYDTYINEINHNKNWIFSEFYGGWFSASIFTETTDADGALDQTIYPGSRGRIVGTFTVGRIESEDIANDTVYIKELGFRVKSRCLNEVAEGY